MTDFGESKARELAASVGVEDLAWTLPRLGEIGEDLEDGGVEDDPSLAGFGVAQLEALGFEVNLIPLEPEDLGGAAAGQDRFRMWLRRRCRYRVATRSR